ncbi:MAG TPA: glycerophosphodiester phosphodiesterase [Patescibacteria group bacterium]
MLVIGHRGASGIELENTIRSLKKAQELGVDMVEFDIRRSLDGQVVLSHDSNLKRLFGTRKSIKDLTVEELRKASNNEIPTLQEALENISAPIDIHVKVLGIEQQVVDAYKNFSSEVLICSTFPGVLKKIRALDEKVKLGLVIGKGQLYFLPIMEYLTRYLNLYSIHPEQTLVTPKSIDTLRRMNRKIFVWTVNSQDEYARMKNLGVDGIITDNPQLFK